MPEMGQVKTTSQSRVFGLLRRALRPSAVARMLWLAVVVLHTGLVARRLGAGEWSGALDLARGVLCLGGVVYGSLKFWRVATLLDSAPRRAVAFALVLVLGHWLLASPTLADAPDAAGRVAVTVLIVTPVLGAAMILASRAGRPIPVRRARCHAFVPVCASRPMIHPASPRAFYLFRRPPPFTR